MAGLVLTTQQLEYLLAIERAATWADAAAAVGVTPSALSQGIAELERRLGVALFERSGRRRVPTRDHAEVLRYAAATVAATHDLERWLVGRRAGRTGTVRLGLIDFRDALLRYRAARPEVELRLSVAPSAALLTQLRRAELDLVVCVQPAETPPDAEVEQLVDDPMSVLAPAGTTAVRPSAWGPWVTFPAGSHSRAVIAEAVQAAGAPFEVVAESHQPEVLREMVRLGIGWTVLPLAGLGPVDDLRVVRRAVAERRLVLARRAGTPPDPVADDLAAFLRGR